MQNRDNQYCNLNTKYQEDRCVNIVGTHEGNQPNINSAIKVTPKCIEKLNETKESSGKKNEGY
jgi:hypothetical protein